jgi:hypothetical protein
MARCALAIVSFRCTPFFPSFCGRERPQGLIHVVGHLTCAWRIVQEIQVPSNASSVFRVKLRLTAGEDFLAAAD